MLIHLCQDNALLGMAKIKGVRRTMGTDPMSSQRIGKRRLLRHHLGENVLLAMIQCLLKLGPSAVCYAELFCMTVAGVSHAATFFAGWCHQLFPFLCYASVVFEVDKTVGDSISMNSPSLFSVAL